VEFSIKNDEGFYDLYELEARVSELQKTGCHTGSF
jgi:hypothetical protein